MIGIALLTLVPGELGGSESSTRELLRALARGGDARLPRLPAARRARCERGAARRRSSPSTGAARSVPERLAAMSLAATRPGPLCAPTSPMRRRGPLPADDPDSRPSTAPTAITLHDVQHLDLPQLFSRAERAFRSLAYHRSARSARLVIVPSAFVRDRAVELLALRPRRRSASSTTGSTTSASSPGERAARAVPALSGAALASQEPRARSTRRSRCSGATGPSSGSC